MLWKLNSYSELDVKVTAKKNQVDKVCFSIEYSAELGAQKRGYLKSFPGVLISTCSFRVFATLFFAARTTILKKWHLKIVFQQYLLSELS